ncbi:MAG: hypothetical protein RLY21_913 [Planctomycetota bacterium]|jgi:hypothetical protein
MRVGATLVLAILAATLGCDRTAPLQAKSAAPRATGPVEATELPEAFTHVLLISVDGLRPECLEPPLLAGFPNFARMLHGPHTLDARTDPDYTITLPNHLSMLTGRPVLGPAGHGWIGNSDPPAERQGGTLHAMKGSYVPSAFDVAHDHGVSTTLAVSKTKFVLLSQSYSDASGAPDAVGRDNGKQKIDRCLSTRDSEELAAMVADQLRREKSASFTFVHFGAPDFNGHAKGWILEPGSEYLGAVHAVDRALGTLLDAIESSPNLRGRTAIVLTADHGGGVPEKTHTDKTAPVNFRIPFLVWFGCHCPADLRVLNEDRAWPAPDAQLDAAARPQPLRNGDAGNLCLGLLGLPPIPGSTYGADRPLRFRPD